MDNSHYHARSKRTMIYAQPEKKSNENEKGGGGDDDVKLDKAPSFNGQTIFPVKVFMKGLKGHKVAAVFAILNHRYKRG